MLCNICGKARADIKRVESKLCKYRYFACGNCRTSKYEPRWLIVLIGRSDGAESVTPYIKARKYLGEEITAQELLI